MAFPNDSEFREAVLELIRRASTVMQKDVEDAIRDASGREEKGSSAEGVLLQILENIELARKNSTPVCQDTGTCIFYVKLPLGVSMRRTEELIRQAVGTATEKSYLRPNAVDSITGKNTGDNLGTMAPCVHFDEWDGPGIEVKLLLKGGGSENVSTQYKLPDSKLGAGRNLDGVYKCVVDAVNKAQGQGCAPGIIGVGVGGDRASGMTMAKKQLFRTLDDKNPEPLLEELEERLREDLNTLEIGPMGFGGKTTVLGVKIGHLHRVPASFFVSVAYMCWASRRAKLHFSEGGVNYD